MAQGNFAGKRVVSPASFGISSTELGTSITQSQVLLLCKDPLKQPQVQVETAVTSLPYNYAVGV